VAVDVFLSLDPKVEGESGDAKHKGEIEVLSFSWGVSNMTSLGSGTGGGAGKATPQAVTISKKLDKSSPKLYQMVALGDHFKKAVITLRKAGGAQQEYCVVTLETVYPSGYQLSGSDGQDLPLETVSLNYSKIMSDYKTQDKDGSLKGSVKLGFDFEAQKKQ
jgi:type VI secretion system secreted protein Hcp